MIFPQAYSNGPAPSTGNNIVTTDITGFKDPMEVWINTLDGFTTNTYTSNQTLTSANVAVVANATSGAFTLTLPVASTVTQEINIKRTGIAIDGTTKGFYPVTLACQGTDKIEDPANPLVSPTATSITMVIPDEGIRLYPIGGTYRIYGRYLNPNKLTAKYNQASSQTLSGTYSKVLFQTSVSDPYSLVSSSTFTCPTAGIWVFAGAVGVNPAATTASLEISLYLGNQSTPVAQSQIGNTLYCPNDNTTFIRNAFSFTPTLAVGDKVEIWAASNTNNRTTQNNSLTTYLEAFFLKQS